MDKKGIQPGYLSGRITVISKAPRRNGRRYWFCRCDCGNITLCEAEDINGGRVRSCGCLCDDQRKIYIQKAIHFVDGTCIEKVACQREIATNTSGHRGVYLRENGKWRAALTFQGKRYDPGTHDTFERAVEARVGEEMITEYLEQYYARKSAAI